MPAANEITIMPDASRAVAASEDAAIFSMIERVATDPTIDIERLERLLKMQSDMADKRAQRAFASDFAAMQSQMPVICERGGIKDRAGNVQSTYALWEDINEAIKPVLTKNGFALSFRVANEASQMVVTGVLKHRDGHSEETAIMLPHDGSGSKNAVQAVGSSVSYGKRYTASALLNITSRGEDDDGKAAGHVKTISQDQADQIRELMETVGANRPRFLAFYGIDAVESLPAAKFAGALDSLNRKKVRND